MISKFDQFIEKLYEYFERTIAAVLMLMMALIIIFMLIDLANNVFTDLFRESDAFLELPEIFKLFGGVMMVLIAIELMSSVHLFFQDKKIHLELMFVIAITAITRKIVIMDSSDVEPLYLVGIAAILAALTIGYYAVQKVKTSSTTTPQAK